MRTARGLLHGQWSRGVTELSCCREGMRAIPVPRGLVTCPRGAFGWGTTSEGRGSAPLRTAELASDILDKRLGSGGRSARSVLFWGVVAYTPQWQCGTRIRRPAAPRA